MHTLLLVALCIPGISQETHVIRVVEGWQIRVEKKLLEKKPELAKEALSLVEMQLRDLVWVLPKKRIEELQRVEIVMDLDRPGIKGLQYHPDLHWLEKRGHAPDLHKVVHIPQAQSYVNLKKSNVQPWVILHEMAHAWHDQVVTFKDPEIIAAYQAAVESKKYDEVLHMNRKTTRHYALTDHKEYFAEGTEAYVGTNDFYPFVRPELKEHDPQFHAILEKIWGRP